MMQQQDRLAEIITEARGIAQAIEQSSTPLSRVALRARRLAQAIDDEFNFLWLRFECEGAGPMTPPSAPVKGDESLVRKAFQKFSRVRAMLDLEATDWEGVSKALFDPSPFKRTKMMPSALGVLEVDPLSAERERAVSQIGGLTSAQAEQGVALLRLYERERRAVLERAAAAIHEWATSVYVAYRLRQQAAAIFERFRVNCDAVLASVCPDAIGKLSHALERASSTNREEWSAAALSCRRVLKAFADAVYPADPKRWTAGTSATPNTKIACGRLRSSTYAVNLRRRFSRRTKFRDYVRR
jgi:hypothetical protein